jgi:hypothetical protein
METGAKGKLGVFPFMHTYHSCHQLFHDPIGALFRGKKKQKELTWQKVCGYHIFPSSAPSSSLNQLNLLNSASLMSCFFSRS